MLRKSKKIVKVKTVLILAICLLIFGGCIQFYPYSPAVEMIEIDCDEYASYIVNGPAASALTITGNHCTYYYELVSRLTVTEFGLGGLILNGYTAAATGIKWYAARPLKSSFYYIVIDCEDHRLRGYRCDCFCWITVHIINEEEWEYGHYDLHEVFPKYGKFFFDSEVIYYIRVEREQLCTHIHTFEISVRVDILEEYIDFHGILTDEIQSYWVAFSPIQDGVFELFIDHEAVSVQIFDRTLQPLSLYDRRHNYDSANFYLLHAGKIYYLFFDIIDKSNINEFTHFLFIASLGIDDEIFNGDEYDYCEYCCLDYKYEDDWTQPLDDMEWLRQNLPNFIWLEPVCDDDYDYGICCYDGCCYEYVD